MRIIIAGAGEVGKHLAQMLSHEEQNIVLMDSNAKRLEDLKGRIEALPLEGDPQILDDLEAAYVRGADLFVSVTPDQATNLIACAMAKRVGAKHTIARVNTPEYIEPEYTEICEAMGVDKTIYPEDLAAREIASTALNPWASQYIELFNGAVVLVGVKIRAGASIINRHLYELRGSDVDGRKYYHVVAIKRDLETIIPTGSTRIEEGDLVFFTCPAHHVDDVRELTGKTQIAVRKMVIMGASRVAIQTIKRMPSSVRICLIDTDKEKCLRLSQMLPSNVSVYHGDGRDPDIISEVGLEDAQVFVALTENSETNVLACLGAKRYNVYKTIAKEENIDYISLAYRLDIGTLINKKLLAAGHIYRMLLGQKAGSIVFLSLVNAEVAELIVGRQSPLVGRCVRDLNLPKNLTFGGMLRNGIPKMIDGNTVIEAYDHVIAFYHDVSLDSLKALFH